MHGHLAPHNNITLRSLTWSKICKTTALFEPENSKFSSSGSRGWSSGKSSIIWQCYFSAKCSRHCVSSACLWICGFCCIVVTCLLTYLYRFIIVVKNWKKTGKRKENQEIELKKNQPTIAWYSLSFKWLAEWHSNNNRLEPITLRHMSPRADIDTNNKKCGLPSWDVHQRYRGRLPGVRWRQTPRRMSTGWKGRRRQAMPR